jgi:branched-chain amino acid transport system permease protein
MVLIGGIGTMLGPVVGAVVLVTMLNYLAGFAAWVQVIQGALFVFFVLTMREGIVGTLSPWFARLRGRGEKVPVPSLEPRELR